MTAPEIDYAALEATMPKSRDFSRPAPGCRYGELEIVAEADSRNNRTMVRYLADLFDEIGHASLAYKTARSRFADGWDAVAACTTPKVR